MRTTAFAILLLLSTSAHSALVIQSINLTIRNRADGLEPKMFLWDGQPFYAWFNGSNDISVFYSAQFNTPGHHQYDREAIPTSSAPFFHAAYSRATLDADIGSGGIDIVATGIGSEVGNWPLGGTLLGTYYFRAVIGFTVDQTEDYFVTVAGTGSGAFGGFEDNQNGFGFVSGVRTLEVGHTYYAFVDAGGTGTGSATIRVSPVAVPEAALLPWVAASMAGILTCRIRSRQAHPRQ